MTDDQGWGDTGYNGHPYLKTPNLDKMAAEGIRFNRFYAAAPVCSPTRGSCVTGRHPNRYGIWFAMNGHLKPNERTIYEILKDEGYQTGHFGKWHLGTLTKKENAQNRWGIWAKDPATHYSPPWENGVDQCFVTESKVPTWNPTIIPKHWNVEKAGEPFGNDYFVGPGRIAKKSLDGDDSRVIMDRVIPFIKESNYNNKPFLAVVWFHTPHSPVVAGPPYLDMYKDRPEHEAHYYGCITAMDDQIGRMRAVLTELDIAENTIITFCSDNGPARQNKKRHVGSVSNLRGFKLSLWEGGIRVPGIMLWPKKFKHPKTIDYPVCTSDYVPTICDVLGIKLKDQITPIDGISLIPLISNNIVKRPEPIAFHSQDQLALIDNNFKLISVDNGTTWQLYNLGQDPTETWDCSQDHPSVMENMIRILQEWRISCRASYEGNDYEY